ncbi:MAG: DUF1850 domain-containing protein [Defluviitaleaceae bacterium]|nr:DUF1850 domain-containing protein [Defluviitaleaceae bacterium]
MKFKKIAVSVTVVFTLLAISLYSTPHIVISSDGGILFSHPASEGMIFSINFIHSVNQSSVEEFFIIRENSIFLSALEFEDFGAGMPTQLEDGQVLLSLPCGRMRIEGFERPVTGLNYIVGHVADLILYIEEKHVPLSDLAPRGTVVEFGIRRKGVFNARI